MLLLKRHLVELVRAGKKRQTLRFWSHALVRANQVTYVPGLGKILVTGISEIPSLAALTEVDAQADGFADLKSLLAELSRIYGPGLPEGKKLFRVVFAWPVEEPAAAEPAKAGRGKAKRPGMTAAQRQELKRHILEHAPKR